jgi:hypothetical protein
MALSDIEKGTLDSLIEQERFKQRSTPPLNFFWLIENIQSQNMRAEALRLTTEAKDAKQAEVDAWPATAQARLAELQAELANLTALEAKLTP